MAFHVNSKQFLPIFSPTHEHPISIIEGTQACLKRLQTDYVDVIFAHRPDRTGASHISYQFPPKIPHIPYVLL